jgi:carboxyl-terminal processing protease
MIFKRTFLLTLFLGLTLTVGFGAGFITRDLWSFHANDYPIFEQSLDILSHQGLNPIPGAPALEYGMIRGMVQAYGDQYTIFVEPAQHELESNTLQGSFGGIGVNLNRDAEGNIILFPYPGSPAIQEGIIDGDQLVGVDSLMVTKDTPIESVQAALRGPVGQVVKVQVTRSTETSPLTFSIKRSEFPIPSVAWHLDSEAAEVGVIQVNLIAASTPDEIKRAVEDLRSRGARTFILDLRNNYGGLLSAGVDIARLFLSEGVIIQQQNRDQHIETYRVEHPGSYNNLPLAVLVNENTASSAEIIAGALKVHSRAKIIGTPTYGKDTIQLVFDLKDGSSLHVTAAKWWVPGLDPPIGGGGLQPDIFVASPADQSGPDAALRAAVQVLLR